MTARAANLSGVLALGFWSTSIAFTRAVTEAFGGPFMCGAFLYLGGGALLLGLAWARGGVQAITGGHTWRGLAACMAPFVLYTTLYTWALARAPSREVAVQLGLVNYLWPLATVLLSIAFFRCRVRWGLLVPGAVCAVAGAALATMPEGGIALFLPAMAGNAVPFAAMLVAAVSWGLYSNLSRRFAAGAKGNAVPLYQLAGGCVFLLMGVGLGETAHAPAGHWGAAFFLMVFPVALAYRLWDAAVRGGDLVLLGAISYAAPLVSTLFACWFLGEPLHAGLLYGCVAIMAGAVLTRRSVT